MNTYVEEVEPMLSRKASAGAPCSFKTRDDGKSFICVPFGPLQIWLGNRVNLAGSQFRMSGVDPGPEPRSFVGRKGAERLQG
jgi:hypothetical protein